MDDESRTLTGRFSKVGTVAGRVLQEFRPYRWRLCGYGTILVTGALAAVAVPLVTKVLVDEGLQKGDIDTVLLCGLLMLVLGLAGNTASSMGQAAGLLIGVDLILELRKRLYGHLQRLPLEFFSRSQSGALLSRVNSDVVEAQGLTQSIFGSAASNLVALTAAAVAMFALSPPLAVIALVAAPIFLIPVRVIGKRIRRLARQQAQQNSAMTSYLSERLNVGGALLRLVFGNFETDREGFEKKAVDLRETVRRRNIVFAIGALLMGALGTVGYASVYLTGGLSVLREEMTVGTLVAMAALVKQAYDPLINIATQGINIYPGLVAFERVYEVLDFPRRITEPANPRTLHAGSIDVEFRDVWFRHPEATHATLRSLLSEDSREGREDGETPTWALHGIDFVARSGTVTAVVGSTGAGKTTLTSLVSRLYDPTSGQVLLGGEDLRDIALSEIRDAIGVVTQEAYLFNATLAENLRVANPDATEEQLREACDRAALGPLVARLSDGMETVVGDRGYRVSGGERQRIALARVFLRNPSVVVLDEATAHLDSVTEQAVHTALNEHLAERTLIVVAHRLSTIRDADQILVMSDGKIVERGDHRSLMLKDGLYGRLYKSHADGNEVRG